MNILSHRGAWINSADKNSPHAFRRSFDLGFGIETDIRDCAGRLVISHDMPIGAEPELEEFLKIYSSGNPTLALNIKSDGLAIPLKQAMQKAWIKDWFVFDMSIPDMRSYLNAGIPVFSRMSEVERDLAWIAEISGVWLDSFSNIWYDTNLIVKLLSDGLRVCIVSPELHGREHQAFWADLSKISNTRGLLLCTDFPEEARHFFGEEMK